VKAARTWSSSVSYSATIEKGAGPMAWKSPTLRSPSRRPNSSSRPATTFPRFALHCARTAGSQPVSSPSSRIRARVSKAISIVR
jgi:hypothetical protein